MSLRNLPKIADDRPQARVEFDPPSDVLARWADLPLAAEADDPSTISIYDAIGEDLWSGGGFTAKRMAVALREIGPKAVTVKINSPGGDMFEGIAIYNLLREHPAKVIVDVVGIAASAASVIAMAADELRMAPGTFLMVHNAWGYTVGNKHDFRKAAEVFEGFDGALADIYEARTGLKRKEIEAIMDAETFMNASEAVAKGFADAVVDGIKPAEPAAAARENLPAVRRLDAALAHAGMSRAARRALIGEIVPAAVAPDTRHAVAAEMSAGIRQLIETIRN